MSIAHITYWISGAGAGYILAQLEPALAATARTLLARVRRLRA